MIVLLILAVVGDRALYLARTRTRARIDAMLGSSPRCALQLPRTPPSAFLQTIEYAWRHVRKSGRLGLRQLLLVACVPFVCGACAGSSASADARVRTSLNLLADVIDPAYRLAMDGCIAREDAAMREGEAGRQSAATTEAEVTAISARCHEVRDVFERMRAWHDEARELVSAGEVNQALARLEEIRTAWRELRDEAP